MYRIKLFFDQMQNHALQLRIISHSRLPPARIQSEAASCQAVRTARNIVADVGVAAASTAGGLLEFAKCSEVNAERDAHRFIDRYRMRLPLNLISINPGSGDSLQGLDLREWARFLLRRNCWHLLCGLRQPDRTREKAIWSSFWERFKEAQPDHEVFEMARAGKIKLANCAAIVYHGDEGRGRKKQPFLVTSFKSMLGRGLHPEKSSQKKRKVLNHYLKQKCNYVGSVYTTHMLSAVLPKHLYRKNDSAVRDVLEFGASCADGLGRDGVADPNTGEYFWMICVAVTGDWQFLAKAGNLARTYYNCEKGRGEAGHQKNPKGLCHMCRAGQTSVPFEELSSRTPRWLATMFSQTGFKSEPAFSRLMCNRAKPEAMYQFDIWHGYHLGVGKTFVASTLALLSDLFPGTSVDSRFEALTSTYLGWCKSNGQTAYLSYIAKETILWKSKKEMPSALWSKGAATRVLMKWLEAWNSEADLSGNVLYRLQKEACSLINSFFSELYTQDAWLSSETAIRLGDLGLKFLATYDQLAQESYRQDRSLYIFMPKHHLLHHIFLVDLWLAGHRQKWIINPLSYATQLSEDFIGKQSRTARRVHSSTVIERVILRYLTKAFQEWRNLGYILS